MTRKPTKEDIKTILTTDARFKVFKEKIKKLGYVKQDAVEVRKVMEKQSDFSMMQVIRRLLVPLHRQKTKEI